MVILFLISIKSTMSINHSCCELANKHEIFRSSVTFRVCHKEMKHKTSQRLSSQEENIHAVQQNLKYYFVDNDDIKMLLNESYAL